MRNLWVYPPSQEVLKFHGYLTEPAKPPQPFPDRLGKFLTFITLQKGLRPETVKGYRWHVEPFLAWFATRHKKSSALSLTDIDSYLLWQSKKWTAWTLRQAANTLRSFFQYARTKNWCPAVLPEAIKGPCFRMDHATPVGPMSYGGGNGISQDALAEALGVASNTIS
jgi:hypothetical protein